MKFSESVKNNFQKSTNWIAVISAIVILGLLSDVALVFGTTFVDGEYQRKDIFVSIVFLAVDVIL